MDENKYLHGEFVFWTLSIIADANDVSLRFFGWRALPLGPNNQIKGYTHDLIKGTAGTSTQPLVCLRRAPRPRPHLCALAPVNMVPVFAFHSPDTGLAAIRTINPENELIFTTCPRGDIELWSWGVHSEPAYGGL